MRLLVALLAFAATAAPSVALACPACAGNSDGGIAKIVALGAMIVFPFAITGVVVRTLRKLPPR